MLYVDIVDMGCGNVSSIKHWIERVNVRARVVSDARDLSAQVVVLPGVGSAGYYLKELRLKNFDDAVLEHVKTGGALIGICLGFQAMAEFSEEDNGHRGLGLIKGQVKKLDGLHSHNQWQPFTLRKDSMGSQKFFPQARLSKKRVLQGRVFFNHEYGFVVNDKEAYSQPISASLDGYSALVVKERIVGMQFHPEKSQITGLELIKMIL